MSKPELEDENGVRRRAADTTTSSEQASKADKTSCPQLNQQCVAYTNAAEYATLCRQWLMSVQYANMMQMNMMMCASMGGQTNTLTVNQQTATIQTPSRVVGVSRLIHPASFVKRLAAEFIDFCFCFVLKMVVVWLLVEAELIDLDRYEKLLNYEADLAALINVTQELFPIELGTKIMVAVVEALYISRGFSGVPYGCTPGKLLMGLRVWHVDSITARNAAEIIAHGLKRVTFIESLSRSLLKNLTIAFLFPLCMIQFAFPYNRGFYDIITKTIVIEETF